MLTEIDRFFTAEHPCPPGLVIGQPMTARDPEGQLRVVIFLCAPAMLAAAPRVTDVARLMLQFSYGEPHGGREDYAADAVHELHRGGVVGLVFADMTDAERARACLIEEIATAGRQ